ncbi:unnamed protein product [Paramecium primaurelia]|uniref:Uncharacterized protein n=1 Tax=Paramecium primaurelia TaxID=5886 RepID=A0A8S1LLE2_PARPR|nr:unnamed protein product [Paramecium primaurelia]
MICKNQIQMIQDLSSKNLKILQIEVKKQLNLLLLEKNKYSLRIMSINMTKLKKIDFQQQIIQQQELQSLQKDNNNQKYLFFKISQFYNNSSIIIKLKINRKQITNLVLIRELSIQARLQLSQKIQNEQ